VNEKGFLTLQDKSVFKLSGGGRRRLADGKVSGAGRYLRDDVQEHLQGDKGPVRRLNFYAHELHGCARRFVEDGSHSGRCLQGGNSGMLSMDTYAVYNATDYDYISDSSLPEYDFTSFDSDSDSDGDGDSDSDSDSSVKGDPYANYDPLDTGYMPDPTQFNRVRRLASAPLPPGA